MSKRTEVTDNDLHALIDGELEAGRRAEVNLLLEADPALAARVASFRSDKEMLKRIYGPLTERRLPKHWLALANGARPRTSWRLVGSIAAVLLLAVVAALSYRELRPSQSGEVVTAALDARGNAVQPERAIAVAADTDARQYGDVLTSAVGSKVKVPDLSRMGYHLTGIRVFARAAELVYRDGDGRVFTLYLRRSDGTARFDQFERDGLRVCVWQDEELSTVMAGDMPTAAMQRLASLAYTGLTL
jgi:anti-sigma factor RsiW